MARGTQLQELVFQLRAEIGDSTAVSVGVDKLPGLKEVLRRTQEQLYDDYDWPFLRVMPTKALAAGQRYYDFPATLNFDRIEEVQVIYNGTPHPLIRGISFAEYASYDSDSDERTDPALKWDLRWTGSATQMEIWPIPTTNTQTLKFKGIKPLSALVSDSDTCDLDDRMIVLFAAAELLARRKAQDASAKLAAANARYNKMKGRSQGGSAPFVMGGNGRENGPRRFGTIIRVS